VVGKTTENNMYENITYPDRAYVEGMSVNGDGGRAGVFLVSHESPSA